MTLIGTVDLKKVKKIAPLKEVQTQYHSPIQTMQKTISGGVPGAANVIIDFEKPEALRPLFVNDSLIENTTQADVLTEMQDHEAADKKALIRRSTMQ